MHDAQWLSVGPGLLVRVVKTGATRDGEIAVTAGLRGGEWVATVGQNKLYKGARVTVDENGGL